MIERWRSSSFDRLEIRSRTLMFRPRVRHRQRSIIPTSHSSRRLGMLRCSLCSGSGRFRLRLLAIDGGSTGRRGEGKLSFGVEKWLALWRCGRDGLECLRVLAERSRSGVNISDGPEIPKILART